MASPYVLWQYFNLMLPYKQGVHLSHTPSAPHDHQLLLSPQQASFAHFNYQHIQHQLMQQNARPTNNESVTSVGDNSYINYSLVQRHPFDFPHNVSDPRIREKLHSEYFSNAQTFREQMEKEKHIPASQSKQSKYLNRPRSPRRSLFTIDAILSKDQNSSKSPTPPSSQISHIPPLSNTSQVHDLEESTSHKSESPPCSPCRSEACSPLQDNACSRPQPLMHSTPQHYNPSLHSDFSIGRFLPLQHPSQIYPLPIHPNLQTCAHRDDISYTRLQEHHQQHIESTRKIQTHESSQNHHHLQRHHQQQYPQCMSSSSPEAASVSSGSNSDMSISNSSSNSNSYTDKQSRKSGTKSKRVRTIFTPEQLERLEAEFERQQYMVGTERFYLANSLNLSEAQVKVWFQNRRIKWRKQHLEQQQARLARGDLYRDLGPLEDEEELGDSHGESDMEEERSAEPHVSAVEAGFTH